MQLVSGLDIGHFLEHCHQLREVEKLSKPGACTVARALRGELNGRRGLTKGGCPAVEMGEILFLQRAILQIAHNRVQFRHRVAHRCTRGKNHPAPAGHFIQIAALAEHVRRFLCLACTQTCDIPHFCVQKEVFERVRFVHKQSVHTQLLEGDNVIFAVCCPQFFQLLFQIFAAFFHLFHGKTLTAGILQLRNGILDFIDLFLNDAFLPRKGKRNALKLTVTDDNRIIVTRSNPGAELLAVGRFKVLAPCNQKFCIRIEVQKFCRPLLRQVVGDNKKTFLTQAQSFCLHSGGCHLEGLPCSHFVGKQRIAAIEYVRNGIALMFP